MIGREVQVTCLCNGDDRAAFSHLAFLLAFHLNLRCFIKLDNPDGEQLDIWYFLLFPLNFQQ